jgi:hypothetical protein
MGDKFPKHIYHSIICIGALVARRDNAHWEVTALGAPHIGERSKKELIIGFVNRIAELSPQLVTFNGSSDAAPFFYPLGIGVWWSVMPRWAVVAAVRCAEPSV